MIRRESPYVGLTRILRTNSEGRKAELSGARRGRLRAGRSKRERTFRVIAAIRVEDRDVEGKRLTDNFIVAPSPRRVEKARNDHAYERLS
jgi:hypothetical protein